MHSICHLALNQLSSQSCGSSKENLVRMPASFLLLSISNDAFPMKSTEQKQKHQEEKVLMQNSQYDRYCSAFPALNPHSSLPMLTLFKACYNCIVQILGLSCARK